MNNKNYIIDPNTPFGSLFTMSARIIIGDHLIETKNNIAIYTGLSKTEIARGSVVIYKLYFYIREPNVKVLKLAKTYTDYIYELKLIT